MWFLETRDILYVYTHCIYVEQPYSCKFYLNFFHFFWWPWVIAPHLLPFYFSMHCSLPHCLSLLNLSHYQFASFLLFFYHQSVKLIKKLSTKHKTFYSSVVFMTKCVKTSPIWTHFGRKMIEHISKCFSEDFNFSKF